MFKHVQYLLLYVLFLVVGLCITEDAGGDRSCHGFHVYRNQNQAKYQSTVNGPPVSDKGMPAYRWIIIQHEIIDIPTHSLGLINSNV